MTEILRKYPSPRGALIVPVHWSHDPEKDEAWAARTRAEFATENEWAREYEIDFGSWVGALAYPNFTVINRTRGLEVLAELPICLACDFNVQPMVWIVCQIVRGRPQAIRQIRVGNDATVEKMVREFRNLWPAHRAELRVYGDATGRARGQTAKSDYALIELAFGGYSAPLSMMVPPENPGVRNRINAVNRVLKGQDGIPSLLVDEEGCPDLIADFQEVAWRPDGKDLLKVYDPLDPYSQRTHASDAIGYFICREFSVAAEADAREAARAPKRRPVATRTAADLAP